MADADKLRTHADLVQSKMFQHFRETADFLAFSLEYQKLCNDNLIQSLFTQALPLNEYFPQTKCRLELWEKGIILVKSDEDKNHHDSENILIVSVGIHGNETAPIEIVRDQLKDILQGRLNIGLPILFIFGNLEAMILGQRQVEENLNRIFYTDQSPHKLKARSLEAQRALEIQAQVKKFVGDFGKDKVLVHYDLHTAIRKSEIEKFSVHPYVGKRRFRDEQFFFLSQMGVEAVLFSRAQTTTFSCYTANEFAAESFTVELGKVAKFGRNDLERFEATNQALRQLYEQGRYQFDSQLTPPRAFDVVRTLVRRHEHFVLPFPENLPNFSAFTKDQIMMEDGDEIHRAHSDGERIVFPNSKVGIGERVALVVKDRSV